jgi:hypothetical protein
MEAKVEDYKDDFVSRLGLYRSFEDNSTAYTRKSNITNPLAS